VPPPHPILRLAEVATGLRALAAELEEIDGEPPRNILWWASEIDAAITDLRAQHGLSGVATHGRPPPGSDPPVTAPAVRSGGGPRHGD
jgi:hypothetical protein